MRMQSELFQKLGGKLFELSNFVGWNEPHGTVWWLFRNIPSL
jgi:hypothetical protein